MGRLLHLGGALLRLQAIVVLVDDGQDVKDTGGDEDLDENYALKTIIMFLHRYSPEIVQTNSSLPFFFPEFSAV